MPLSKHFRFCLWWESFFNGGHFSTCQTRKKSTPVTFFLHTRHVFLRPGVISLRRKMTPRSIFDGGRYSSLHRHPTEILNMYINKINTRVIISINLIIVWCVLRLFLNTIQMRFTLVKEMQIFSDSQYPYTSNHNQFGIITCWFYSNAISL